MSRVSVLRTHSDQCDVYMSGQRGYTLAQRGIGLAS